MNISAYLRNFGRYIKAMENWYEVPIFRLGIKNSFNALFRDGSEYYVTKENWDIFRDSIKEAKLYGIKYNSNVASIEYKDKTIELSGNTAVRSIIETFIEKQYAYIKPNGKEVVDIGAGIGDTALYFIIEGAEKVYAYEPYPTTFSQFIENISKNKMNNRIEGFLLGLEKIEGR